MAAVSTIGNAVYINQNMQTQAALHAGEQTRFETQVLAKIDEFNAREKVVEEVRAPEENYGVDPDREHEKRKHDNNREQKEQKKESDTQKEEPLKRGLLDISV